MAGTTAAEAVRRQDRSAKIVIIESSSDHEYSRCGLPYYISGEVDPQGLFLNRRTYYDTSLKATLLLNTTATKVDPHERTVSVSGPEGERALRYDALILATGAEPVDLPIPGINKPGVMKLRTLEDARAISGMAQTRGSTMVIGAGLIGLELTDALLAKGQQVTVIEMMPEVLPASFDPGPASVVRKELERKGATFMLGKKVERIVGFEKVEGALVDGSLIKVDSIVACAGIRPRSRLAKEAGVSVGRYGGIKVDYKAETDVKGIFAAGDCIELVNRLISESRPIQLATVALRTAEVAGANAAGGDERIPDLFGNTSSRICGLELSSTGLTEAEAREHGLNALAAEAASYSYAPYYPGGRDLLTKLVVDSGSGQLLGAQFVGPGAASWGNLATMMMSQGIHISALAYLETNFSPPVQNFWPSPVVAARRITRLLKSKHLTV